MHDQPREKPNKTKRGITTEQLQDSYKFQGATPPSYPLRSWPAPRRTQRFVTTAVNDWEPESVTGLVDTAKTWHGFQNSTGAPRAIINKAVKHGISTG